MGGTRKFVLAPISPREHTLTQRASFTSAALFRGPSVCGQLKSRTCSREASRERRVESGVNDHLLSFVSLVEDFGFAMDFGKQLPGCYRESDFGDRPA